jgi:phenylpropionate dioxygenase-like ring-hydroxylating dioxygenase large terminal subunit
MFVNYCLLFIGLFESSAFISFHGFSSSRLRLTSPVALPPYKLVVEGILPSSQPDDFDTSTKCSCKNTLNTTDSSNSSGSKATFRVSSEGGFQPPLPTVSLQSSNVNIPPQLNKSLYWYVIGETTQFLPNKLHKIQVWDKFYVVWRSVEGQLHALQDACSHRSASLSNGQIIHDRVACPYHGYEFDTNGTLVVVPGVHITKYLPCYSVTKFDILEKNGWVYLNILPNFSGSKATFEVSSEGGFQPPLPNSSGDRRSPSELVVQRPSDSKNTTKDLLDTIYSEPETSKRMFRPVFLQMDYLCYSRVLSENILDLMHIPFTHTFGNVDHPAPIREDPPTLLDDFPYHYQSRYLYKTSNQTIAKFIFGSEVVTIENEFILPHTTISRVIFDKYVKTVVASVLPIGNNKTRMFTKVYRNFWVPPLFRPLGDLFMYYMMYVAMLQDKKIVDNIDPTCINGKYNMKYDRLQNIYRILFRKFIHEKI